MNVFVTLAVRTGVSAVKVVPKSGRRADASRCRVGVLIRSTAPGTSGRAAT